MTLKHKSRKDPHDAGRTHGSVRRTHQVPANFRAKICRDRFDQQPDHEDIRGTLQESSHVHVYKPWRRMGCISLTLSVRGESAEANTPLWFAALQGSLKLK
jgi:hypothetical protein